MEPWRCCANRPNAALRPLCLARRSRTLNNQVIRAAAKAPADVVSDDEPNANRIIPVAFGDKVANAVDQ
ncbi:hypothetical protein HEP84_47260 [Streptomyces sp. RLB1-33]|nr:hypothetical protein [Streptomyces sp. RLB1-33]QIY75510.1 hypothetical protein HEP84_47260 [Streptomyces sp. RLB1-33]